jgi:hypothetical protein
MKSGLQPATSTELKPRQYAQRILALPDRESRKTELAKVPAHFLSWVETLVKNEFEKRQKSSVGRVE